MRTPVGRRKDINVRMFCSMSGRETSMEGVSREDIGSPILGEYGILAVTMVACVCGVVVSCV
jgi:hypothetical protein